jgi:hypothetical protein
MYSCNSSIEAKENAKEDRGNSVVVSEEVQAHIISLHNIYYQNLSQPERVFGVAPTSSLPEGKV